MLSSISVFDNCYDNYLLYISEEKTTFKYSVLSRLYIETFRRHTVFVPLLAYHFD